MVKVALLIGVSQYESELTPLPAADRDVAAMQRVLEDPELGGFDQVATLLNPSPSEMQRQTEQLFTGQRQRDDLVVWYFSGHGIRDSRGNLFFATPETDTKLLRSTAVSARFIHDILQNCRARRQVIVLDCCFSGAFDSARLKDDGAVDVAGQLGAEGRVVLASSSALEPSIAEPDAELSLYTRYLVEGISTGAADLNEDGHIEVQELHDYAAERVQSTAPSMTPKLIVLKELGFKIILSKAKVADPRLRYRKTVAKYAQGDSIRPAARIMLDTLRVQLNLDRSEAEAIEAEVFQPFRERRANLEKYRQALQAEAEHQFPLDEMAREVLQELRRLLGLRSEDVTSIEHNILALGAKNFRSQGNEKYEKGDYEGALVDYNEALRLKPDHAIAYNGRGAAKGNLGDDEGALADYNEALRLKPDYAAAYYSRGITKMYLGDHDGALADYDEALRLEPGYVAVYYNRGSIKNNLGDYEGALADYNKFLRLNPDYAAAYNNRGIAKTYLGDYEGALADYDEALRLEPDDAATYYNRGFAKNGLGDYEGAIISYQNAAGLYQKQGKLEGYRNALEQIERFKNR